MTNNLPEKQSATFPAMLEKFKSEIARALPRHLDGDRMCRIALTEFRKNPKLAECDPKSVFAAVIQSSQLGLECGLMGEASLVPFGKECQLIPGYTGLMKLAMNTGKITDIYAHSVRENDEFEIVFGLDRTLKHRPLMDKSFPADDEKRGPVVGYYSVAVFKDGQKTFQAMSNADVLKIRDASLGYKAAKKWGKASTWDTHPEAMGIKTVIRRLCKYLPKSPELAQALALDTVTDQTGAQKITLDEAVAGTWAPDYQDVSEAIDVTDPVETVSDKFSKAFEAEASNMSVPFAVFERFIGELAAKRNTTADDMMQAAVDDPGRFMEAVKKYLAKSKPAEPAFTSEGSGAKPTAQQTVTEPTANIIPPTGTEPPPQSTSQPQDQWEAFRASFINIKSAGFSTFVYKNLEQLKECPMNIKMEAVAKWNKFYPNTLYPLNAPPKQPVTPVTLDQLVTDATAGSHQPPPAQDEPTEPPQPASDAQPQQEAVPVSYSPEYKALAELKNQFPEHYHQARTELGIPPHTVMNCLNLTAKINQLVEQTIEAENAAPVDPPIDNDDPLPPDFSPPLVTDSSGF